MANIVFTIPSVLNAGGGEKKTEISADSLQDAFIKISEIFENASVRESADISVFFSPPL